MLADKCAVVLDDVRDVGRGTGGTIDVSMRIRTPSSILGLDENTVSKDTVETRADFVI